MKARYEHLNSAVEGDKDRAELEQSIFVAPPPLDLAGQDAVLQEAPNHAIENIPRYDEDLIPDFDADAVDLGEEILDDKALENNPAEEPTAVDGDASVDGGASSSSVYGPPTKSEVDLRREARSTRHLLRHKPFNRYCEDCCKSKMAQRRHFAGSYQRDPKKWGEIVTADHLVSH